MLDYASAFSTRKHGVGGSDAHNLRNIARYWTEAPVPDGIDSGKREWLAAVARGEGRAVGSTIGAAALMADVYRIIGRYYLSLREPEMRRTMRVRNYLAAAALAPASLAGVPAFFSLGMSLRIETATLAIRRALRRLRREREETALPAPELAESPLD
jgi:hypothetical protein